MNESEITSWERLRNFKIDYLIGMTKVQRYVECIADKLKVKYDLTDDQYIDLVDHISNEQFNSLQN